jgi:ABC-type phosphate transport system auxiliary subunit
MGEQDEIPRRRNNKVYGSLWINSEVGGSPPVWMLAAPLFVGLVMAVGCFGLVFLGWDGTPGVGP